MDIGSSVCLPEKSVDLLATNFKRFYDQCERIFNVAQHS